MFYKNKLFCGHFTSNLVKVLTLYAKTLSLQKKRHKSDEIWLIFSSWRVANMMSNMSIKTRAIGGNDYFVTNMCVDTTENGPVKECLKLASS